MTRGSPAFFRRKRGKELQSKVQRKQRICFLKSDATFLGERSVDLSPGFLDRHGSLPAPPRLGSIAVAFSFSFPSSSRAPRLAACISRCAVGATYRVPAPRDGIYRKIRRVARPCGFYIARPSRAPRISFLLRCPFRMVRNLRFKVFLVSGHLDRRDQRPCVHRVSVFTLPC